MSKHIVIEGTFEEELTSEDYDLLFDQLQQLGIENIRVKETEGEA